MIPRNIIETFFGSPARIRILRVLLAAPQPLSGRQVAELAGLSHRGAIQALDALVASGTVRQRRAGKAYQYSLAREHAAAEKIILPALRAETELLDDLRKTLAGKLGRYAVSLTLYGSAARGEERRGSDIDVFAVAESGGRKKELEERAETLIPFFRERYHALLSLHCMTHAELRGKAGLALLRSVRSEGVHVSGTPIGDLLP